MTGAGDVLGLCASRRDAHRHQLTDVAHFVGGKRRLFRRLEAATADTARIGLTPARSARVKTAPLVRVRNCYAAQDARERADFARMRHLSCRRSGDRQRIGRARVTGGRLPCGEGARRRPALSSPPRSCTGKSDCAFFVRCGLALVREDSPDQPNLSRWTAATATAITPCLPIPPVHNIPGSGLNSASLQHSMRFFDDPARRPNNLDRQSLRGFLHMVESEYPDELLRIQRAHRPALRHDRDRLRTGARGQESGGHDRKRQRLRHAGSHQRRRKPPAARGMSRRRSRVTCPRTFRERCQKYIPCETVAQAAWNDIVIEGDDVDLTKLPITAAIRGRRRALHHRRPAFGARSGDRRRHHGLSPAHAQGQESARRVAAFAPAHVRISPPRRGAGQIPAGGHHHRHPSAALHGIDGLRLSAGYAEIRDHRRPVRRALPVGALRHRRSSKYRPAPRS